MRKGLEAFIDAMRRQAQISIVGVGDRPTIYTDYTNDRRAADEGRRPHLPDRRAPAPTSSTRIDEVAEGPREAEAGTLGHRRGLGRRPGVQHHELRRRSSTGSRRAAPRCTSSPSAPATPPDVQTTGGAQPRTAVRPRARPQTRRAARQHPVVDGDWPTRWSGWPRNCSASTASPTRGPIRSIPPERIEVAVRPAGLKARGILIPAEGRGQVNARAGRRAWPARPSRGRCWPPPRPARLPAGRAAGPDAACPAQTTTFRSGVDLVVAERHGDGRRRTGTSPTWRPTTSSCSRTASSRRSASSAARASRCRCRCCSTAAPAWTTRCARPRRPPSGSCRACGPQDQAQVIDFDSRVNVLAPFTSSQRRPREGHRVHRGRRVDLALQRHLHRAQGTQEDRDPRHRGPAPPGDHRALRRRRHLEPRVLRRGAGAGQAIRDGRSTPSASARRSRRDAARATARPTTCCAS